MNGGGWWLKQQRIARMGQEGAVFCPKCEGSGAQDAFLFFSTTCDRCKGNGKVRVWDLRFGERFTCFACNGAGGGVFSRCARCNGHGELAHAPCPSCEGCGEAPSEPGVACRTCNGIGGQPVPVA